jgi:hypothetical protein
MDNLVQQLKLKPPREPNKDNFNSPGAAHGLQLLIN